MSSGIAGIRWKQLRYVVIKAYVTGYILPLFMHRHSIVFMILTLKLIYYDDT